MATVIKRGSEVADAGEDGATRFAFTEARLHRLSAAPAGQRIRYHDTVQPGLVLRVTARARTFGVYCRIKGRPVDYTLGSFPTIGVKTARKLAIKASAEVAAGDDPQSQRNAIRAEMTLGELFDDFLKNYAKIHKRTWEDDKSMYKLHLSSWANRQLSVISASDVQAWHARIGRVRGQGAANRCHILLRKLFNYAKSRGFEGDNPAIGVRRFTEVSRDRFLSGEELRALLVVLAEEPDRVMRDFFLLAMLTGARRGNVQAMRWADLDLDQGLWRIPAEDAKAGQALTVVLVGGVVTLLRQRRALVKIDNPWVLPGKGKTGHLAEPHAAWSRILTRAEILRLVDAMNEKRGLVGKAAAAEHAEVDRELDRIRGAALGRRGEEGVRPLAALLTTYRKRAAASKIDPGTVRMDDLRIHDLRRSLGSWMAAAGASLPVIGKALGHRQTNTTAIYARLNFDPVRAAVEGAVAPITHAALLSAPPKAED